MNQDELRTLFEDLWVQRPLGNKEQAFAEFHYAILKENIDPVLIIQKYKEYLSWCAASERPEKYVKGIINFIRDKDWNGSYKSPRLEKAIERMTKNAPIDPPASGKPKFTPEDLKRTDPGPDGKDHRFGDGDTGQA